jgi:transketolase
MCRDANAAHIGSSLSCAELLVFLRFAWMTDDDRFVLSKGHAAAALYSVLAEARLLTQEQLESFHRDGTRLPAHPPINTFEQIPFATGSLGYGLSVSAGMALGAALKREERRYFCVTSDGELDEGSVWEAALFIGHRRLTNVVWLIDRNRIQAFGRTEEVMALEPLDAKLRAFGFHVIIADGHDFPALLAARDECSKVLDRRDVPVVIIADTVKGNGVSFLRDTVDSHYQPLDAASYERALTELTRAHESALAGYRDAR